MTKAPRLPTETKPQIDKFKEAARELETDDSEAAFDEKLKKVAKRTDGNPPSRLAGNKKPR